MENLCGDPDGGVGGQYVIKDRNHMGIGGNRQWSDGYTQFDRFVAIMPAACEAYFTGRTWENTTPFDS